MTLAGLFAAVDAASIARQPLLAAIRHAAILALSFLVAAFDGSA